MICPNCKKEFHEGQRIIAQVLSIYHDLPKPIDSYRYAVERPLAFMDFKHMYCGDD